ncbi:hypothetical protein R3P38DRAFT_3113162 [Favolaschia claudopus]|uniref:Uncharacterized protein n=1 Tax=Favolaschia claudopus TaxID=2862362 RepID=A0AAV9ZH15_9AGAR
MVVEVTVRYLAVARVVAVVIIEEALEDVLRALELSDKVADNLIVNKTGVFRASATTSSIVGMTDIISDTSNMVITRHRVFQSTPHKAIGEAVERFGGHEITSGWSTRRNGQSIHTVSDGLDRARSEAVVSAEVVIVDNLVIGVEGHEIGHARVGVGVVRQNWRRDSVGTEVHGSGDVRVVVCGGRIGRSVCIRGPCVVCPDSESLRVILGGLPVSSSNSVVEC